jgi:pimeloyl-ACP methyl ester carboxylesterase
MSFYLKLAQFFLLVVLLVVSCDDKDNPKHSKELSTKLPLPTYIDEIGNGFSIYHLNSPDGTTLKLYGNELFLKDTSVPLLLVISGSGCTSLFMKRPNGKYSQGLVGYFDRAAKKNYAVLAMEKRGVNLGDTGGQKGKRYCTPEYDEHTKPQSRIKDHLYLIDKLKSKYERIFVAGHSEGSSIAAGVAANSKAVEKAGYFSGGGFSQMLDFIVLARKRFQKEGHLPEDVEAMVDGLYKQYRNIFEKPSSNDELWQGHPYSRWHAYFSQPDIGDLLKVEIPIFMAAGTRDESVPIESSDFIAVEFIRHGKKNLTYRRYPGLDHNFRLCSIGDSSCDWRKGNRLPEVVDEFFAWLENKQKNTKTALQQSIWAMLRGSDAYLVASDPEVFPIAQKVFMLRSYNATTNIAKLAKAPSSAKLIVLLSDQSIDFSKASDLSVPKIDQIHLLMKKATSFVSLANYKERAVYIFSVGKEKERWKDKLRSLAKEEIDRLRAEGLLEQPR